MYNVSIIKATNLFFGTFLVIYKHKHKFAPEGDQIGHEKF